MTKLSEVETKAFSLKEIAIGEKFEITAIGTIHQTEEFKWDSIEFEDKTRGKCFTTLGTIVKQLDTAREGAERIKRDLKESPLEVTIGEKESKKRKDPKTGKFVMYKVLE